MIPLYFPLNSTSLGASAIHILENMQRDFSLFPIGGIDAGGFKSTNEFNTKLNAAIQNGLESHDVNTTSIKLWHHFAGYERVSKKQILYTFHELDNLTPIEINSLNQQEAIVVPCNFNKETFVKAGVKPPVSVVPLGVDRKVFYPLEKHQNKTGPYVFIMAGKFEVRKLHMEILQAFMATFANNRDVKLRCCIANRFIDMKAVYGMINERIFQGKPPNNIEFIDWLPTEHDVADFISHADCLISPSRGESFNLPLLQAMSCGTNVITNADHAHADYVNSDNATIIPNGGKVVAFDGTFFRNDGKTNTGSWFNINTNAIASGLIESYQKGRRVNTKGIETAEKLSWQNTAKEIINIWDLHKT